MQKIRLIVVQIFIKLGLYRTALKVINYFRNKRLGRAFRKNGLRVFKLANDSLKQAGITFFPEWGTLLGIYRDKNFIKHDFDLDSGVIYQDNSTSPSVVKVLTDAGFTHVRQYFIKDTLKISEDRFTLDGVQLDIFYNFREGDNFYVYLNQRHETLDWRQANVTNGFPTCRYYLPTCEFIDAEFKGFNITIPAKTDDWLKSFYGENFRTPIKNWSHENFKLTRVNKGERVYRRFPKKNNGN